MRVYFLADTTDGINWGGRATTTALKELIIRVCPDATIDPLYVHAMVPEVLIYENPIYRGLEIKTRDLFQRIPGGNMVCRQILRSRGYKLIRAKVGKARDVVPQRISEFDEFAQMMLEGKILRSEAQSLDRCDVVVINGEGGLYERHRFAKEELFLAYMAKKHYNKPCIMVNHSVELSYPDLREIVETVYPLLDDVVFREPISYQICEHLSFKRQPIVCGDAAFLYRPTPVVIRKQIFARSGYFDAWGTDLSMINFNAPYICISGSSLFNKTHRPEVAAYDPVKGLSYLLGKLRRVCPQLILVASDHIDEMLFTKVLQRLDFSIPLVRPHIPFLQGIDILAGAAVFISGRYHPSIFALSGGTPIITFTANFHKMEGLTELMELEYPTLDALNLEGEANAICDAAEYYLKNQEIARARIIQKVESVRSRIDQNVRFLRERFGGSPSQA